MVYPFTGGFHNSASYVSGIPWMTTSSITSTLSTDYTQYTFPGVTSHLSIRNDGPGILKLGATTGVTGSTGKYVTIPSGGSFETNVRLSSLYLSPVVAGTTCAITLFVGMSTVPVDQSPTYTLDWL